MPPIEGEQNKPRRQKSNPRRQKANAQTSSDKRDTATLPTPSNPTVTPTKPKSILQRSSAHITQLNQGIADTKSAPATPPRSENTHDTLSPPKDGEISAAEHKGQRRKKSEKILGHQRTGSSSPMLGLSTPKLTPRPHSLTPGRTNGTPLQAYAGPTFHASPAASSLPMPKFFSKSVPAADKGSSLSAMMDKEVSDTSPESPSDNSEESPTLGKAQHIGEYQAREESPLDIFFQADRREKAKQQTENPAGTSTGVIHNAQPLSMLNPSSGFVSPSGKDVRHHSRHATGSSVGELFPLEIDDKTPNMKKHIQNAVEEPSKNINSLFRPNSAPPDATLQADSEEVQRKAKTLLLKKLLMSPQLQHPADSPRSEVGINGHDTSSSEQSSRVRPYPGRSLSGTPTPTPSYDPAPSGRTLKQTESLPLLQNLRATQEKSTNSPRSRPNSSNLRREVTLPTSPMQTNVPELPATPTSSPRTNQYLSSKSLIHQSNNSIGNTSTFVPDYSSNKIFQGMDKNNTPTHSSNSTKTMEDDLRRILKLNVLGGNGANGVRS